MFQTISMKQLETYLESRLDFTLLDVRDRCEFAGGHLMGAVNIPLEELEIRTGEISRDRPVIVYCAHGSKSLMAARFLDRMGFCVAAAAGGLSYYRGRFFLSSRGGQEII